MKKDTAQIIAFPEREQNCDFSQMAFVLFVAFKIGDKKTINAVMDTFKNSAAENYIAAKNIALKMP